MASMKLSPDSLRFGMTRWLTLVAGGAALGMVAACGSTPAPTPTPSPSLSKSTSPLATTSPSTTPGSSYSATPASGTGLASCDTSHVSISAIGSGGAAGTLDIVFGLTNIGTTSCTMDGYPTVQMETASGSNLATHPTNGGEGQTTEPTLVQIAPHHTAFFEIFYADGTGYGNATCPTSAQLAITIPGGHTHLTLKGSAGSITPFGGGTISQLQCGDISVGPVSSTNPSA